MEYKHIFNKDDCWYKNVCHMYDTPDCNRQCIRHIKMHYLAETSLLTRRQQGPINLLCPEQDSNAVSRLIYIKKNIVRYIQEGTNLVVMSYNTGNGKTSWMCKLLMSYFDEIWNSTDFKPRGLFVNTTKFLQGLKGNITEYSQYIQDTVRDVDVVVWDDVLTDTLTDFEQKQLFYILDDRLNSGKSNFYTTNASNDVLQSISPRLHSRIFKASEVITFTCCDLRGTNL